MEDEKDIELQDQEQEIEGGENTENKEDPQYRGKVLMQRALDHLEKGNIEEFETDRALANKFFDEMNAEEEEMDALYNESRNFGIIYQVIESNVPTLLETKEGQKALRKIIKTIKGNKILHEQFPNARQHEVSLHSVFLGRPGTGKTTVCKIFGSLLRQAGALSKGHVVVCDRGTL